MKPRWIILVIALLCRGSAAVGGLEVVLPSWTETVRLSQQGDRIAFGQGNGDVLLSAADDGKPLGAWPAQGANQVTSLEFSADGTRLLAVSPNRVIRLISTREPGRTIAVWRLDEFYPGAALTLDGRHVLTVANQGPLRWCDAETGAVIHEWRDPAQVQGYSAALLLDDAGLAVVTSLDGDAALVDAANGKVFARLVRPRGGYVVRALALPGGDTIAIYGGGTLTLWSRAELLAAKLNAPNQPIKGRWVPVGGDLGAAVVDALSPPEWVFWKGPHSPELFTWSEPSFAVWREAKARGPVLIDGRRQRAWRQTGENRWHAWSWAELGRPEALSAGGYLFPPRELGEGVVLVADVNGYSVSIDWQGMVPLGHGRPLADPSNASPGTDVWSPAGAWLGRWSCGPDRQTGGWSFLFTNAHGEPNGTRIAPGLSGSAPGMRIAPDGSLAVFGSSPARKVISSDLVSIPAGVEMTLPSLQIWEADGRTKRQGVFNDLRSRGVANVKWSHNSRWVLVRLADGEAWRIYDARDGKRHGTVQAEGNAVDVAVGDDGQIAWSTQQGVIRWSNLDTERTLANGAPWARSARVAISQDGRLVACLTGDAEVVVLNVVDGSAVERRSLVTPKPAGWEGPDGGVVFVGPRTLVVSGPRNGMIKRIDF